MHSVWFMATGLLKSQPAAILLWYRSGMNLSKAPFRLFSARSARTAAMPFIMLTTLLDMIAIGLMIPVLPALVGSFTGTQADQAFWYGMVTFSFSLANFFASPVLGALSDRYGRRPVLLMGFCGLALSFFATALATAVWMLLAVRLVSGAMQSNLSVANAYVADITPPEQRAKRFGMLGAMFGVGFILGPVMGGLLGAIDLRLPFFAAGSLALLNLLYGYFVLPESLPPERRHRVHWSAANPVASLRGLAQLQGAGRLVAVIACSGLAQFVLYTSWVLYATFKFGWGPRENGWSLAAVGVVSAITQGLLLGRLLKRFSPQRLAVIGMISSMLAYAAWGAATQGWMMFAIIFLNFLSATVSASIQSIISGAADARSQGKTLGAVSGLNSLMAVIAPMLSAPLLVMVSHLPPGDWRIGAPMYFCALLQAAALWLAVSHFRRQRSERRADAAV
jgi:DHA1 family tetracycline resistance protein-like MFS transporter